MAEPWAEAVLAGRRRARADLIDRARSFVETLAPSGDLVAAVVYGSVARGDFNVWSDIDLLLVLRSLPARLPDRLRALTLSPPAGVQVIAWTPEEFGRAYRGGNPIALEVMAAGEVLHGHETLRGLAEPGR